MQIFGIEHTKREYTYLIIILILLIGFFLSIWAKQEDININRKALVICTNKLNLCQEDINPEFNLTTALKSLPTP